MSDCIEAFEAGSQVPTLVSLDRVEDDCGNMSPNGWHIEFDNETGGNVFYDPNLTDKENALLNLEVDPYIERLLYSAAEEKGTLPEKQNDFVEEELDDTCEARVSNSVDFEKLLNLSIPLFDEYIRLSKLVDKATEKFGWDDLREKRNNAWEKFIEEMDWNWFALDQFDDKADKRLLQLEKEGKEVDESGWNKFLATRSNLIKQCGDYQQRRKPLTYSLYEKALEATQAARGFWKTKEGKAINLLKQKRREAFLSLQEPILDGYSPWMVRRNYFQLLEEDISRTYLSNNDNSGVDDPDEQVIQKDTMEGYLDTHLLEQWKERVGETRAIKDYDKWFDYKENHLKEVSALMKSIDNEM